MDAFKDGLFHFLLWLAGGTAGLGILIVAKEVVVTLRDRQPTFPKFDPALERDKNKSRRTPMVK